MPKAMPNQGKARQGPTKARQGPTKAGKAQKRQGVCIDMYMYMVYVHAAAQTACVHYKTRDFSNFDQHMHALIIPPFCTESQ